MSDSIINIDDTFSILGGFSTESGYSLGEECDLEHDQWLQNYLTTIDKIVLLGKSPAKGLTDQIINECLQWREKFRIKFTESERGAIFLKYSNQTESNWNNIESSRGSFSKGSSDSFKWDPSRLTSRFSAKQSYHPNNSTTSKSSSGTSRSIVTLSSRESFGEEIKVTLGGENGPRPSRSIILQPLQSTIKTVLSSSYSARSRDDSNSSIRRPKPVQLPPINNSINQPPPSSSLPPQSFQSDQIKSKSRTSVNLTKKVTNRKGFPSPPVFFSINDIFSTRKKSTDYLNDNSTIKSSLELLKRNNQLIAGRSLGFVNKKAEKYQKTGSLS
ncbi:uncharacterized protein LOC128395275 [Panonychus citri]|uniref:uncharacterized protein LOC128395275 n=1 Tax=Panonychus citri TaxID=50023 RepID=UPI0023073782|nr:uncharacterized protein LOC128395275 [Panonychus citri]